MWEKRYGFPAPKRIGKAVRTYSDQDVEKLRVIARLLELGYRPGDVMGRATGELVPMLQIPQPNGSRVETRTAPPSVEQIVQWLLRYDVSAIASGLRNARASLGLTIFVRQFARPLMENIGSLWERGELEIRHEHLISDLLASELRIHLAANRLLAEPRVLLATFPGEQHRLGLELWAVDMVANKLSICILGADSPVDQIAKTAAAMDVHVVGIYASDASDADNTRQMIAQLVSQLPRRVRVWLGGNCAERLGSLPEDTERFDSYEEFDRVVNALVREHRKK